MPRCLRELALPPRTATGHYHEFTAPLALSCITRATKLLSLLNPTPYTLPNLQTTATILLNLLKQHARTLFTTVTIPSRPSVEQTKVTNLQGFLTSTLHTISNPQATTTEPAQSAQPGFSTLPHDPFQQSQTHCHHEL
jgi:hypothetical protein